MSKLTTQRWMVAAALAASLGFGAAQALATPREASTASCARCRQNCIDQGNSGGVCIDNQCICFIE